MIKELSTFIPSEIQLLATESHQFSTVVPLVMENLLSVCRDLEILLSAFQIEAAKAINWHSCHLAYSLSHISSPTHTSGRRWGLTNRPFISCQSSFIGFKWSLITTVLQSPIMVFFPPYGVWWEGEAAQCVCMCVCYILTAFMHLFAFHHIGHLPF